MLEINNFLTACTLNVSIANIPFFRHNPIKNLGPAGDFMQFKGDIALKMAQSNS